MAERPQFVHLTGFAFMKANKHYSGSYKGLQYSVDVLDGEQGPEFEAAVWPAPYCREETDPALCETARFGFDEAGMQAAGRWVEEQYAAQKSRWSQAAEVSILDAEPWQPPKEPDAQENAQTP